MKYVIVAGGTAGHINPAIALGEELQRRGHKVYFAGTPNRLESKLVPDAGFEFTPFEAYGFNRKKPQTLLRAISSINTSTKQAKIWLSKIRPVAVVGFGCYVSLSVCRAAIKLQIPVYIHEQNSVMGMANKYLSNSAKATCLTYKHADTGKCKRVEITGNPVRRSVIEANRDDGRNMLNVKPDSKLLVVFGGSLGAEHINRAIVELLPDLLKDKTLEIVHITGQSNYDEIHDLVANKEYDNSRYHLMPYQNEMGKTLAACDCVISRAGASSLAEISALNVPALLIPFPLATENHQYYNALDLVNNGCSMLLDDSAVGTNEFKRAVKQLVDDQDLRLQMVENLQKMNSCDAANKLANVVSE